MARQIILFCPFHAVYAAPAGADGMGMAMVCANWVLGRSFLVLSLRWS